ncbi:MAG: HAD-IIA family hydrolase [Acidimicrobiia bacterium]|nr:HAD-IIA family hydrolase [Acidimicrobiia bacterium]
MADGARRGNLVIDLDGVVYVGDQEVPGAGQVLTALDGAGYQMVFATNNASRTPQASAEKITAVTGYAAHPDQVVSSALAAASLLHGGERCLVIGGVGLEDAVVRTGGVIVNDWRAAEVVFTGYNRALTYDMLRDGTLAVRAGARFIASNDDATFPAPDGLWPGAGATVSFLRTATEVVPELAGKPHEPMRRLIRTRMRPGPVWMVGDRPETDLAMAKAEGWTSVLALTGVVAVPETVEPSYAPDFTIASIVDLPAVLEVS